MPKGKDIGLVRSVSHLLRIRVLEEVNQGKEIVNFNPLFAHIFLWYRRIVGSGRRGGKATGILISGRLLGCLEEGGSAFFMANYRGGSWGEGSQGSRLR
jgi:hypothetical protein